MRRVVLLLMLSSCAHAAPETCAEARLRAKWHRVFRSEKIIQDMAGQSAAVACGTYDPTAAAARRR